MHTQLNTPPRRLMGASLLAFALLQFGALGVASAQDAQAPAAASATAHSALGPLKHVKAGLLDVAYAEVGPADGPVVILLHGWPYD
ncbi:MAG: alpha/beta hydrolase, partial [Pseudomonas sp.]